MARYIKNLKYLIGQYHLVSIDIGNEKTFQDNFIGVQCFFQKTPKKKISYWGSVIQGLCLNKHKNYVNSLTTHIFVVAV